MPYPAAARSGPGFPGWQDSTAWGAPGWWPQAYRRHRSNWLTRELSLSRTERAVKETIELSCRVLDAGSLADGDADSCTREEAATVPQRDCLLPAMPPTRKRLRTGLEPG